MHAHAKLIVVANKDFKFEALRHEKRGLACYTGSSCLKELETIYLHTG